MKRIDRFTLNLGYIAIAVIAVAFGIRVIIGGAMLGGFQALVYGMLGIAVGVLGVSLPISCWERENKL